MKRKKEKWEKEYFSFFFGRKRNSISYVYDSITNKPYLIIEKYKSLEMSTLKKKGVWKWVNGPTVWSNE